MATQQVKRMIGIPAEVNKPWANSTIAWGTGITKTPVPPSVSNPASLTPWVTQKPMFSDNMTKPILAPVVTAPTPTTPPVQPISTPTPVTAPTPTVAPTTWVDRTAVDKVNQQTLLDSQKANWPQANENGAIISQQEITPKVIAGKTINFSDGDPTDNNNYLGTGMTKADALAQLSFDQLYELEQNAKQYIDERAGILGQTEYLAEQKKQMEYDAGQRDLQKQGTDLQNQNAWIKSSQMIRQEQDNLDKLRQNTAFLGSGGRPVVSKGMLDSYARTLSEAQTTYNELVKVEENAATMRALGAEFDSKQYAENVRRLNKDLTDKVDSIILDAFNNAQSDIISGAIDTPQKLTALQQKYLGSIDSSVHAKTQRAVNDMKILNDRYNKEYENVQAKIKDERQFSENKRQEDVKRADEFKKNASTVNDKLSAQTGYLTDGNGEVMVDKKTGIPMVYDPYAAEKPTVTADGKVVTFSVDPVTGKTVASFQELWKKPQELQVLGYDDSWKAVYGTFENWVATPVNVNGSTNSSNDPASNPTTLNISNPQTLNQIIDFCTTKRGTDNVQCGMLVNDYIMKVTGTNPSGASRFQDSLESKITAIDNIGRAAWPVAGGLFAYPTNDPAGHTGIVTKVNPDGSIEVLEANVKGSAAGWPPKVSTYPASKYKSWTFSQAPAGQKEAEQWVNTAGDAVKNIPWVAPVSKEDQKMQVLGLTQGLWGTEWERAMFANNILKKAQADWITLAEAKKKLGYKSGDDVEFAKARKEQFTNIAKNNEAITKGKSALTLLAAPQTAVNDVAAIVWFLKTIDPSSVARESEVESVESARGMLDNISVKLAKLKDGKKLSTEQRQELRDTIGIIVNAYENNMRDFISSSSQEFNDRGLDMSVYVPKDTINKYSGGSKTTTSNNPYSQYQAR